MAWIPVDQSLRNHRKLVTLAGELEVSEAAALGHLVFLWLWCVDNAPDGIIKQCSTDGASKCIGNIRVIATASAWRRNPNKLVNALLSAGFLERCGRGGISLRIHDWNEYGGKIQASRDRHREISKQSRDRLDQSRSEESREEKSRSYPPKPPQGGAGRRRRKNDSGPLSGQHRDKVNH